MRRTTFRAAAGLDDVRFEVLHPAAELVANDNDSSCVLSVRSAAGTALLTGDIEATGEAALLDRRIPATDVVVVPHHGSRTSSSEAFAAALAPKVAIVSAGYRNRWGLPKPEVLARWREQGARVYTTAQSGAVEVSIARGRRPTVREHREASGRYWSRTAGDRL